MSIHPVSTMSRPQVQVVSFARAVGFYLVLSTLLSVSVALATPSPSPSTASALEKEGAPDASSPLEQVPPSQPLGDQAEPQTKSVSSPQLVSGWTLTTRGGVSSCFPSGEASCDSTYPGFSFGGNIGYYWRYVGLTLDADWGTLTPSGTGSDQVSMRFTHIGLALSGLFPISTDFRAFTTLSLGPGWLTITDKPSDSQIEWSSLWSDLRVDLGTHWAVLDYLSIEASLSLLIHSGGTRCLSFQGAGPCSPVSELPSREQDIVHTLLIRGGAVWGFPPSSPSVAADETSK